MTCPIRGCWGALLAFWILGLPAPAWAAEDPAALAIVESFLGPEPLAYAEVSRPAALWDRIAGDRFQGLLQALPDVAKALQSDDLRQLREVVDFVAVTLDTNTEEALRQLTGGGLVVALEAAEPPRLVVVVTPEDPEFLDRAHARVVELARQDARNKGNPDPIKQAEYRGLTGFSVSKDEAHAIIEGHLVIASGSEALKTIIDRRLDGQPTLAEDPTWTARKAKVDPDALAWAFADIERLKQLDPDRYARSEEADPGAILLLGAWIEALNEAPWALAELTWADDQRLGATLTVPTPPEGYSEAFSRFLPTPGQRAPASLELPGTIASIGLWRDFASVWEVRAELFPPEVLQGFAQLDTFAGQFFGGRDFGADVLGALGDRWQLVAVEQDHDTLVPKPDIKLPAFALIVSLRPDDEEFARRLLVAFQSIIGLANLGTAQTGAPPLMLGSEVHQGVAISTATFMVSPEAIPNDQPVHYRHNFAPSAVRAGDYFIISSSVGLARNLVDVLKDRPETATVESTLSIQVDGRALAQLAEANREQLVLQNMLEEGTDKTVAERNIDALAALLRYFNQGTLRIIDEPDAIRVHLDFELAESNRPEGN